MQRCNLPSPFANRTSFQCRILKRPASGRRPANAAASIATTLTYPNRPLMFMRSAARANALFQFVSVRFAPGFYGDPFCVVIAVSGDNFERSFTLCLPRDGNHSRRFCNRTIGTGQFDQRFGRYLLRSACDNFECVIGDIFSQEGNFQQCLRGKLSQPAVSFRDFSFGVSPCFLPLSPELFHLSLGFFFPFSLKRRPKIARCCCKQQHHARNCKPLHHIFPLPSLTPARIIVPLNKVTLLLLMNRFGYSGLVFLTLLFVILWLFPDFIFILSRRPALIGVLSAHLRNRIQETTETVTLRERLSHRDYVTVIVLLFDYAFYASSFNLQGEHTRYVYLWPHARTRFQRKRNPLRQPPPLPAEPPLPRHSRLPDQRAVAKRLRSTAGGYGKMHPLRKMRSILPHGRAGTAPSLIYLTGGNLS